jgi:hypothetical protein
LKGGHQADDALEFSPEVGRSVAGRRVVVEERDTVDVEKVFHVVDSDHESGFLRLEALGTGVPGGEQP